ncbi:putative translation factor pelota [Metallosphaera yellowstonensis MK1]|uniref:Protein pelota homolog n=1 Tax=Metallosphaera yellowstonensis MK1 TaxID=671065 RepID=H2C8R4_9CREN|nr:mRNA surveillance protein pelota [Metallosphaera yellowstonensis]EHP68540.1 putative translation factor pelota [Metallosphaera yellowstonensis MK1]
MRVLEYDERRNYLRLYVEDEDDLWLLHTILTKGDVVIARTTRDVSMGNESRRIPMTIQLRVEFTEFQSYTGRLRIHGIVEDAPEKFGIKGSHHTINLDLGEEIVIVKPWTKAQLERIEREARKRSKNMIVLVDQDELLIAIPMEQGIKILVERALQGINEQTESLEDVAKDVAEEITQFANQYQPEALILAGPGPFKEIVKDMLRVKARIYVDSVSTASRAGLAEILKRDIIDQVMRDYSISKSTKQLERALGLMARDSGLVVYGLEETREASTYGAVETLLVSEDLITDDEKRSVIEEVMNLVESKGGNVMIVPKDSPVYHQLKALSGIIGILRFRYK